MSSSVCMPGPCRVLALIWPFPLALWLFSLSFPAPFSPCDIETMSGLIDPCGERRQAHNGSPASFLRSFFAMLRLPVYSISIRWNVVHVASISALF